jgi:hypothetical protein
MHITYSGAKELIFARGEIPDGYFGKFSPVSFAFDPFSGKTLVVSEVGFFRYMTPPAIDTDEALFLLKKHQSSNARNIMSSGNIKFFRQDT